MLLRDPLWTSYCNQVCHTQSNQHLHSTTSIGARTVIYCVDTLLPIWTNNLSLLLMEARCILMRL